MLLLYMLDPPPNDLPLFLDEDLQHLCIPLSRMPPVGGIGFEPLNHVFGLFQRVDDPALDEVDFATMLTDDREVELSHFWACHEDKGFQ